MKKKTYEQPVIGVVKMGSEGRLCLTTSGGNETFVYDNYDGSWEDA